MADSIRLAGSIGIILLLLFVSVPSSAQIEDQLKAYTGDNGTGYLQPLADAFGSDLNCGLFHSAHIPETGVHISFGFRVMSVIFGSDDRTFGATTESGFSPKRTTQAPTVVGPGEAVLVDGNGGTQFAFPGGFDLNSFALAVPQLRIGAFRGTEALIRFFAINTGDVELGNISIFGFGLRHSLSQYRGPDLPVDVSAGFFWQKFSVGDDLLDSSAFTAGVQAGKRFERGLLVLQPYTGLAVDVFSMDVAYESEASGTAEDIEIDFGQNTTLHLTMGLSLNLAYVNLHAEYNVAAQNSFSFGISFGN